MDLQSVSYFLFLGAVALMHWILAPRWRIPLLLAGSFLFYAVSGVGYFVLFLMLCTSNYVAVAALSKPTESPSRVFVFLGVLTLDLAILISFKYLIGLLDFAHLSNAAAGSALKLAIPLGISYFTFQMIACATDAYRRDWELSEGWDRFVLFGFFFPQVTSGPIPRAGRLLPQLSPATRATADDFAAGARMIFYGLFKKLVVANRLNDYATEIFAPPSQALAPHYSTIPTALGVIYNVLNLYADFSSYVDIAIGSARILGIRLDPNFDRPLLSQSITELWRRWHMTLSFWLRDYLFMPLLIRIGDPGHWGAVCALMITFAICGIWHGATWPYLCFGLAQGAAMSAELLTRRWRNRRIKRLPERLVNVSAWIYAMSVFFLSEILFRASSLDNAGMVFGRLFRLQMFDNAAELFAHKGPFDFILDFVVVGMWFVVSFLFRRPGIARTPGFALICAIIILLFGRDGNGLFIYAGF
jgi:D-alanyl-lipoteichoic acid acyltransferase DltB (MBOAT superfamily)